jgi:putative DNA primase/helicase
MLIAALGYAARGWDVFPAPPGEKKKSHKSAKYSNGANWGKTRDPEQIRKDFNRWPKANVGIPTGPDNGFWVVEADTPKGHDVDGIASLRALEEKHGPLPTTLMAESPSGSLHYYFKWPDAVVIKNTTSGIAPGIDVRGEGGMVIAPPSVRGDGAYRWLNDNPIAEAPQWLLDLVSKPNHAAAPVTAAAGAPLSRGNSSGNGAYAQAALEREIDAVAKAPPGQRNHTLNTASFNLHQLVAMGELSEIEVREGLFAAATTNGLVNDDGVNAVLATIKSGAAAGLQQPRAVPERSARPRSFHQGGDAMKDDTGTPGRKHNGPTRPITALSSKALRRSCSSISPSGPSASRQIASGRCQTAFRCAMWACSQVKVPPAKVFC